MKESINRMIWIITFNTKWMVINKIINKLFIDMEKMVLMLMIPTIELICHKT